MTKLLIVTAWTFSLAGALAMVLAASQAREEVSQPAAERAPSCVGVLAPGESC